MCEWTDSKCVPTSVNHHPGVNLSEVSEDPIQETSRNVHVVSLGPDTPIIADGDPRSSAIILHMVDTSHRNPLATPGEIGRAHV